MNKIASVILFDVGCRKLSLSNDSYFHLSKQCLTRLILRKIFSEDSDDVGIVLFGSEISANCMMEKDEDKYSNIRELCVFGKPNFRILEEIDKITQCKGYISDWILAMIVALEYLRKGIQGKRYKLRQLVMFSEFPTILDYKDTLIATIASCMKDLKVKLIIVGPDLNLEEDDACTNLKLVFKLFSMIDDPLSISLNELADSIKYFEKKRKGKRVSNVDLEIGSCIRIPVGWVKLTCESQRFSNWIDKHSQKSDNEETVKSESNLNVENVSLDDDYQDSLLNSAKSKESTEDVFKIAKFGQTEVTFSSADINALKRESGLPSFKILMFCSKRQVNPTVYVGEDVYAVMPREGSKYAQAKLYALINAMREKNRVAIARRIVMRNGKVQLGVLIPFSDEYGKHLFFLKLPTAEWSQPYPRHRGYPTIDPTLRNHFKTLIDTMRLPSDLYDQGLLVPNPHFQARCHILSQRAINASYDLNNKFPDYINNILNPCPEIKENIEQTLNDIISKLPALHTEKRKNASKARALARSAQKESNISQQISKNDDSRDPSREIKKDVDSSHLLQNEHISQLNDLINQLSEDVDSVEDIMEKIQ